MRLMEMWEISIEYMKDLMFDFLSIICNWRTNHSISLFLVVACGFSCLHYALCDLQLLSYVYFDNINQWSQHLKLYWLLSIQINFSLHVYRHFSESLRHRFQINVNFINSVHSMLFLLFFCFFLTYLSLLIWIKAHEYTRRAMFYEMFTISNHKTNYCIVDSK